MLAARLKALLGPVMLFARQELGQRYRGSALGLFWVFVQPLAQVLIFSVVFTELMGARMPGGAGKYSYSVYLIGGVLLWNAQVAVLTQVAQVYQAKASVLTKTRLSLVITPLYVLLVEAFFWLVGMGIFSVFLLAIGQGTWQALWQVPLAAGVALGGSYAAGLSLAMLGVFLPDIRTGLPVVLQLLFWATPIVYVLDLLPPPLRALQAWNPLYWGPAQVQHVLMGTGSLGLGSLARALLAVLVLCLLARFLQRRLERDIRDLL